MFSSVHIALNDRHDFDSVLLALSALIPSCCIVPYLTLITRKPFAAPVFTVCLADGEQPGATGELARRRLNDQRRAEEVQDLGPDNWYTRGLSPGLQNIPGGSPG
jgi:hypothetical protein